MKSFLVVALLALGALSFFVPQPALAQPASLVPCGSSIDNPDTPGVDEREECTVCHFVALGQRIMNFFIFGSVVVATLLFVNAGALYVFSPGNPGNISKGHRIFTNTLVGILFILVSWIVVDFIIRALVRDDLIRVGGTWGPWNEILCKGGPVGPEAPELDPPADIASPNPMASDLCDNEEGHRELARMFNVPYPARDHPDLGRLVACVTRDPAVASLLGGQPIFTTDRSKPLCNYTRGNNTCYTPERCSHSVTSCHYGGARGSQGAMGADLNAADGTRAGEQALWNAVNRVVGGCGGKIVSFATHPNHTHISLLSCDRN